ncbi:MAG: hypothetical protein GQ546_09055 [Gammaproteobacteria bacterium]|nr:hypothetical protein [Gammaproteobacteria bacterium]
MTTELYAIAFKAQCQPKHRFQNLYRLLKTDLLHQSWQQLNKQAAAGLDGISIPDYQSGLQENITRLSTDLKHKRYRASGQTPAEMPIPSILITCLRFTICYSIRINCLKWYVGHCRGTTNCLI